MREKIKRFCEKISNKISSSPTYIKSVRKRDKLAQRIKSSLLAIFNAICPVWSFIFLKTQDPDESHVPSNEIRQDVIKKATGDCWPP